MKTSHNRRLAKKRVQWLNKVLCFYSSSVLVDSYVLRNPPERNTQTVTGQVYAYSATIPCHA